MFSFHRSSIEVSPVNRWIILLISAILRRIARTIVTPAKVRKQIERKNISGKSDREFKSEEKMRPSSTVLFEMVVDPFGYICA